MKNQIENNERQGLEAKMSVVFAENIVELSTDFQHLLLDDLVTAFENRLKVLSRAMQRTVADAE